MAVRALNPLEQHAGKIFLGVVLLVCAILVWFYVVGDPVGIEIGGKTISVDAARKELEDIARKIIVQTEKIDSKGKPTPLKDPKNDPPVLHDATPPAVEFGKKGSEQLFSPVGVPCLTGGAETKGTLVMLEARPALLLAPEPPKPLLARERRQVAVKAPASGVCNYVSIWTYIPADSQKFITDLQNQATSAGRPWPLPNRTVLLVVAVEAERQTLDENGNVVGEPIKLSPPFGVDLNADRVAKANPPPPANASVAQWIEWGKKVQAWCDTNIAPTDKQEKIRRQPLVDGTTPPKVNTIEIPATGPDNPPAVGPVGVPPPGGEVPGVAPVTVGSPNPACWTMDDKVESGKQYKYRTRYVIFNPLVGTRMMGKDPQGQDQDRNTLVFASAWSDWSERIQIEQDLFIFGKDVPTSGVPEFYVYRQMPDRLFQQSFRAQVGEYLGGKRMVRRAANKPPEEVDFSTRLLVVDVRQGDALVKQPGAGGNSELVPMPSTQVVFQNEAGQLFVRSIEVDKASKAARDKEKEFVEQDRAP